MNVNFSFTDAAQVSPVIFEKVLGEKPGGGMIPNPAYDLLPGTAIAIDSGVFKPIKAFRLVKANLVGDTTIEIAKGSGIETGDAIGNVKKAVACTAVDKTNATKDVVTVTMGVAIDNGTVLYQAAAASASSAVPIYTPKYLLGTKILAGKGGQAAKLVVAAVVRKETVNASNEVLALLPTINAV